MIEVSEGGATEGEEETPIPFFLFAATSTSGNAPHDLVPVEQFAGVPEYYLLHVANTDGQPRDYKIDFTDEYGKTIHVGVKRKD